MKSSPGRTSKVLGALLFLGVTSLALAGQASAAPPYGSPVVTFGVTGSTAAAGGTLPCSITGANPGDVITVSIGAPPAALATFTADATGSVPGCSVKIPQGYTGAHTLTATDGTTQSTSIPITVTGGVQVGLVISNPNPNACDSETVTISGAGPGDSVVVFIEGPPATLGTFKADASGGATGTVTIPCGLSGNYNLVASDPSVGGRFAIPLSIGGATVVTQPGSGTDSGSTGGSGVDAATATQDTSGDTTIVVAAGSGSTTLSAVDAASVTADGSSGLAFTGAAVVGLGVLAVGLLAGGAMLLFLGRRRVSRSS